MSGVWEMFAMTPGERLHSRPSQYILKLWSLKWCLCRKQWHHHCDNSWAINEMKMFASTEIKFDQLYWFPSFANAWQWYEIYICLTVCWDISEVDLRTLCPVLHTCYHYSTHLARSASCHGWRGWLAPGNIEQGPVWHGYFDRKPRYQLYGTLPCRWPRFLSLAERSRWAEYMSPNRSQSRLLGPWVHDQPAATHQQVNPLEEWLQTAKQ